MDKFSYLSNTTPEVVESMYQQYLADANSVDATWQKFFEGFDFAKASYPMLVDSSEAASPQIAKESKVLSLIEAYRDHGHLFTKTNPVRERRKYEPNLDIENFGLSAADLETVFQAGNEIGIGAAKLKDIVAHLNAVYCNHIGVEYTYIRNAEKLAWLKDKLNKLADKKNITKEKRSQILKKLGEAVGFEKYMNKKFIAQKRFSLEGGESLIPALDAVIQVGAEQGLEEVVMGMAHRGRLNVLANIFGKPYSKIFTEFEGLPYDEDRFDGDVKYHLGYNSEYTTVSGKKVKMNLLPNPSHLETVASVASGMARAFADQHYNKDFKKIVPIIIHGDAAIAGQGLVYEMVQMSKLESAKTGGTIHVVVNNQVGFTTNYLEARSSIYCTDIAKIVQAPVFHVNADDVEAVYQVMEVAMEYRQKYNEDIFIDLLGYRKHGHNEGDEPRFTQPKLYKTIDKHQDPFTLYSNALKTENVFSESEITKIESDFNAHLDSELEIAKNGDKKGKVQLFLEDLYKGMRRSELADFEQSPETGVDKKTLLKLAESITTLPDMKFNRKVVKIFNDRKEMIKNNRLDWAMGELLAYATYLNEGKPVRLVGQDAERGTFSHRHAVLKTEEETDDYTPLNNINEKQAKLSVYNSLLSEYGAMGFEYGYALATPNGLTLWEAQFGDFVNGAQIIIDQYLTSAEDKWKTQNGLVLLLPHGYEGQGAEHSSARLERFLNNCAEQNIQVVNCTTPANFFHVLRRQVARPFRKPLVVMSPKSLLRHAEAVSTIEDLAKGRFQEVIDDASDAKKVKRVLFCSGKIYYELAAEKAANKRSDVAIVRLEQLFPYPAKQVQALLDKYKGAKEIFWVQEEPENMGAWGYLLRVLNKGYKGTPIDVIAQPASASPATGSSKEAATRQKAIIAKAFK